jgi:hypothetical protein
MRHPWLWTLAALVMLAACGGGGGGTSASMTPVQQPSPVVGPVSSATATLVITIPPKGAAPTRRKHPNFLTSSVQGVAISALPDTSPSPTPASFSTPPPGASGSNFYALTPQSTYCTGGGASPLVCTLALQAPPGTDVFTVKTYDTPNLSGNQVGQGTAVATIAANAANTLSVTVDGIPTQLTGATPAPLLAGTAGSTSVTCCADADGFAITGPFASELSFTTDDTTGGLTLSPPTFSAQGTLGIAYSGNASTATSYIEQAGCPASLCSTFAEILVYVPSKTLYVGFVGNFSVAAFAPGTSTQIRTLAGVAFGVTVASNGVTYTSGGSEIDYADPGVSTTSNDAMTYSLRKIMGANTALGIDIGDDAFAMNTVYVANPSGNSVLGYSAGFAGNIAPNVTLAGASTLLSAPNGLATDSGANLWVAQPSAVLEFTAGANGNVAPAVDISGGLTGLNGAQGVAVDASGTIYVTTNTGAGAGEVEIFSPGSNGNVAPVRAITGTSTGLGSNPIGVAVDGSGNLYVADTANNRIAVFPSGGNGNIAPTRVIALSGPPAYIALSP